MLTLYLTLKLFSGVLFGGLRGSAVEDQAGFSNGLWKNCRLDLDGKKKTIDKRKKITYNITDQR